MRTCRVGFGILLLALSACGRTPMQADAAAGEDGVPGASFVTAAPATRSICSNEPFPAGHVVVSARNTAHCGATKSGQFNEFVIARVTGDRMVVCSISPLPASWAVTHSTGSNSCPESSRDGWAYNVYTITRITGVPIRLCSVSPMPRGWVIIQASVWTGCPGSRVVGQPQNVFTISPVRGPQMSICRTLSPVPDGWVVTQAWTGSNCPASRDKTKPLNVYVIKELAGREMRVCSVSLIPRGWMVVAGTTTKSCPSASSSNTLTIRNRHA